MQQRVVSSIKKQNAERGTHHVEASLVYAAFRSNSRLGSQDYYNLQIIGRGMDASSIHKVSGVGAGSTTHILEPSSEQQHDSKAIEAIYCRPAANTTVQTDAKRTHQVSNTPVAQSLA